MIKTTSIQFLFAGILFLSGCGTVHINEGQQGRPGEKTSDLAKQGAPHEQDPIAAMTWEKKVKPGVSVMEVEQTLASVAAEYNLKPVGEFQVSQERQTPAGGPDERFIKIYSYCTPSMAKQFIHSSPHMAAFMPCRIALVENEDGLWLYSMNLDLLLQSAHRLPPELQSSADKIRSLMKTMLERASEGDF